MEVPLSSKLQLGTDALLNMLGGDADSAAAALAKTSERGTTTHLNHIWHGIGLMPFRKLQAAEQQFSLGRCQSEGEARRGSQNAGNK